jgi:hypothetical protein
MNPTPGPTKGDTELIFRVPRHGAPARQEFWVDTCREITHMHATSKLAIDFYRQFGCRFCEPTHAQVDEVLAALDAAMPEWDSLHPELFYKTLELNFPELVRRS